MTDHRRSTREKKKEIDYIDYYYDDRQYDQVRNSNSYLSKFNIFLYSNSI